MQIRSLPFSAGYLCGALLTSLTCSPILAQSHPATQAYALKQQNPSTGTVKVLIAGTDARFDCIGAKTSILVSDKSNSITILNHQNKTFWKRPLKNWTPATMYVNNMLNFAEIEALQRKMTATRGELFSLPVDKQVLLNPTKYSTPGVSKEERLTVISGELTSCPTLTTNQAIISVAEKLYRLPKSTAFPLRFEFKNRKGTNHIALATNDLSKVKDDGKTASIPADYKIANSEREASLNPGGSAIILDVENLLK